VFSLKWRRVVIVYATLVVVKAARTRSLDAKYYRVKRIRSFVVRSLLRLRGENVVLGERDDSLLRSLRSFRAKFYRLGYTSIIAPLFFEKTSLPILTVSKHFMAQRLCTRLTAPARYRRTIIKSTFPATDSRAPQSPPSRIYCSDIVNRSDERVSVSRGNVIISSFGISRKEDGGRNDPRWGMGWGHREEESVGKDPENGRKRKRTLVCMYVGCQ